jgi:hypothetical protein
MNRQLILLLFVVFAILVRLIPHPPNFAPITALAIFSGFYYRSRLLGVLIPLTAMLISDIFLGFSSITPWVYASFISISVFNSYQSKINLSTTLFSSILFFVISNFGVWVIGYPKSLEGLLVCYTMAIPFFVYSILGDLFYTGVLSTSFNYIDKKWLTTTY